MGARPARQPAARDLPRRHALRRAVARHHARRAGRAQCGRREGAGRPREDSARPAPGRRTARLRPVQVRVRGPQGRRRLPSRVLRDPRARRPAGAQRNRRADAVRDRCELRDLAQAAVLVARVPRTVRRTAEARRGSEAHPAARDHGSRAAAAPGADPGRPGEESVFRTVHALSGRDSSGRARTARRRRAQVDRANPSFRPTAGSQRYSRRPTCPPAASRSASGTRRTGVPSMRTACAITRRLR